MSINHNPHRMTCHLCKRKNVVQLMDFGSQPICNRYRPNVTMKEFEHSMVLGQCSSCGLVQMTDPVPANELKPRYDWITYVEPEGHLDRLAEIMAGLPGIHSSSVFCAMTFKDDSLLDRMKKRGFERTWRLDPHIDLGLEDSWGGVETVQDRFDPEVARRVAQKRGRSDVLIARHILEHAHHLDRFVQALRELVKPDGLIVIELPDCSRALDRGDCTTLWEEHVLYFTPETFRASFSFFGCSPIRFETFPYPLEDSLVGIGQFSELLAPVFPTGAILAEEHSRAETFFGKWNSHRERFTGILTENREKGKIALMGAGHLSCAFINLMGLQEEIDFVVDNDPHKKGLLMPGSRLPIRDSDALLTESVKLCLLGVNPANQQKVIDRNQRFLEQGGIFLSIFPNSAENFESEFLRRTQLSCP